MASLLPDSLIDANKQPASNKDLKGKVIGLYFSAHWCPPCRGFTPKLCEWYANFKKTHEKKDDFELVFVSSDRDEQSFKEYHNEMNFWAVPFANRDAKANLSTRFGVRGIPTLVFVDAEGNTLTKDGRAVVMEDPQGARFPWAPKSFAEILGTSFIDNKKNKFTAEHLKGKVLGLYFSAHWCGPCRGFTPTLVQLYNKLKVAGKPFEIIFVSSDRDEASFDEYFNSMPWLALDPADGKDARKAELSSHFEVDGIPTLVILDENHKIITSEGRGAVSSDPEGAEFPWLPKPLNALDDSAQSVINDFPFLVAETDGSPEAIAAAKAAVADAAEAEFAKASPRLKFFYLQDPDEGIYDAIRRFAQITKEKLYIVSAQTQKKYIAPSQEITKANVDAFVQAFYDGKLEAVALR